MMKPAQCLVAHLIPSRVMIAGLLPAAFGMDRMAGHAAPRPIDGGR